MVQEHPTLRVDTGQWANLSPGKIVFPDYNILIARRLEVKKGSNSLEDLIVTWKA